MSEEQAPSTHDDRPLGASPTHITNPELRHEARKAFVWLGIAALFALTIYISQSLLIVFGALVFAALIDGGARLIGKIMPVGRSLRVLLVLFLTLAFFLWLGYFAGNQITAQAAALPQIIEEQAMRLAGIAQHNGFELSVRDLQMMSGQLMSGVGTLTRVVGGLVGGFTTVFVILIIGIYVAFEPDLYERGVEWMTPRDSRSGMRETLEEMGSTMRRLLAGRLAGMAFEGLLTFGLLELLGVPMAAFLGIVTGLFAFVPFVGAIVSGLLMVLVGFSVSVDTGLYAIGVYLFVQTLDGYVVIPLIAKKTVDLAPALVLAVQLFLSLLFGIMGLLLADPLLAMIKVALERRGRATDAWRAAKREGSAAITLGKSDGA